MKRWIALCALLAAPPAATAAPAVSGQLIVGFEKGTSDSKQERILSGAGGRFQKRLGLLRGGAIRPRSRVALSILKARLRRDPDVEFVEPDFILEKLATPNDPLFPQQYGLPKISAPSAWDQRHDCARVAVLDTGVDTTHPDLKDNLWKASNGDVGYNAITGKGDAEDDNGHGTNVAGIIAGRGNNGLGVSGVCWTGSIEAIKFMNSRGKGSTSDAIDGINYAVGSGAKIVNCSFGTSSKSDALQDAIDYAKDKDVLLVVAAGNDSTNIDKSPSYPASYTDGNILTVAATGQADGLASFSNYGSKGVDMAAPGVDIESAALNGRYGELSGTSQATPFVAASAAILKKKSSSFDYSDLRSRLKGNVDKLSSLSGRVASGGRLNLRAAL